MLLNFVIKVNSKIDLDCNYIDRRWSKYSKAYLKKVFILCLNNMEKPFRDKEYLCSLNFSNSAQIKDLNKIYRKKNKDTNVLSFQYVNWSENNPDYIFLGEIFFSYEKIESEAAEKNISFDSHLYFLLIHGLLHLFGYDHKHDNEAEIMENLEREICKQLGLGC